MVSPLTIMNELMKAFLDSIEAQSKHDKVLEEYDGYEWDHHGYYLIEEQDKANERLQEALGKFIDKRVSIAIAKLQNND